jgi:AcrR family transcriptional regulator
VSARTFFNYYPSKEDAVLGIDEIAVADELDNAPASVDDPLSAVFDLLYAMFEAGGGTHGRPDLTREVVLQHPTLMSRHILRVTALEGQLTAIIAGWLGADPRFAGDSQAERATAADLILSICLATVRVSMKVRVSQNDTDSADMEPGESVERAVASLRTVMEKLT